MTPLTGLGIWIWEMHQCEGGSVPKILARSLACGVSHLIIKAGEENANGQVTPGFVRECRALAVEPAIWWYSRPAGTDAQIAMLEDLVGRCGVRAIVQDAEREWDAPDNRELAAVFAARIRAAVGPDVYIADAPWSRPLSHGGSFPYQQFGAICDARSPQFYWELAEVGGDAQSSFLKECDAQWTAIAPGQTICPAGSAVDSQGVKHAAVTETEAFLERYLDRPSRSLWSWQHLDADEWRLLATRAAKAGVAVGDLAALEGVPDLELPGRPELS